MHRTSSEVSNKPSRSAASPYRWQSYGITHVGRVRKNNEDALLTIPDKGLWVVADGMGGHQSGNTASQMIVKRLEQMTMQQELHEFVDTLEDSLMAVNTQLLELAAGDKEGTRPSTIGSTVALLHLRDKYCYYAWLGDSRVYRLRDGQLRQMTTDHSQVEEYVEMGLISRWEARNHPHGNMITRAVGVTANIHLDMDLQELQSGDRYLLCSDGVTKHIEDIELQDTLGLDNTEVACTRLTETVLERGGTDNLSAIVVSVSGTPESNTPA